MRMEPIIANRDDRARRGDWVAISSRRMSRNRRGWRATRDADENYVYGLHDPELKIARRDQEALA